MGDPRSIDPHSYPVVVHRDSAPLAPPPPPLALGLLAEIAQLSMDRMNSHSPRKPVSPWEAHTLGKITAIAVRYPGVLEMLQDPDVPG